MAKRNYDDLKANVFYTGESLNDPIELVLLQILKDKELITQAEYNKTAYRVSREARTRQKGNCRNTYNSI